ncbi:MAG: FtsL-like putative cell division protein [Bacteroidota bacterium]|nr:FtsL-like putative cell division protein [Bacteroidota bacterium]
MEGNTIKNKKAERKAQAKSSRVDTSLQSLLGGSFLAKSGALKMLPFLLFLTMLALVYIANIYIAEKKNRKIEDINGELKELRYEYITTKSELMYLSNQSQLAKKLAPVGIKESRVPPEKIVITEE